VTPDENHHYAEFIDGFAHLMAAQRGMPLVGGRIFAYLLVCEPAEQTALQVLGDIYRTLDEATGNALAKAVFFNRLGEIRDRSFEQQRYRASGLNLITAAIVLWNTVYLERAMLLWPRLDRNKLSRYAGDPARSAQIVQQRTSQPYDSILAMLTKGYPPIDLD